MRLQSLMLVHGGRKGLGLRSGEITEEGRKKGVGVEMRRDYGRRGWEKGVGVEIR